jgi:hypothetical protein
VPRRVVPGIVPAPPPCLRRSEPFRVGWSPIGEVSTAHHPGWALLDTILIMVKAFFAGWCMVFRLCWNLDATYAEAGVRRQASRSPGTFDASWRKDPEMPITGKELPDKLS